MKEESLDDELNTVINPDDFLNSEFFKMENENGQFNSESSDNYVQLTPPISPIESIKIIPAIVKAHSGKTLSMNERKIKPILPAKSHGTSDSDSNNNSSNLDKAQLKLARLIRNRESAIQSRRKKKEHLQKLEVEVNDLRTEVRKLKEENYHLKEKLLAYSSLTCRCARSISSKISPAKNTNVMMFALLLMIGFNIFSFIPLGSYPNKDHVYNDVKKSYGLTSRHLLFVENNIPVDTGSSKNAENDLIPMYFNQTDRIRKANIENVLNWIPQPEELLNLTNNFKEGERKKFKKIEDPLQYKFAQMYEKSRSRSEEKSFKKKMFKKGTTKKKQNSSNHNYQNLYNPNSFKLHEFFDEINRRGDTFYVLSFNQNFLLPAIENFSQTHVKMNLLMPRNNETLTSSDKIMMMQIETIVLNTSLIEVAEKSIPSEFVKNSNSTIMCNQQNINNNSTDSLNYVNVTENIEKVFPYFHFDLDRVGSQK